MPSRAVAESAFRAASAAAAALVVLAAGWIAVDVVTWGWDALTPAFLLSSPEDAGRGGGILPILVSSLLVLGVCLATALPLGLGAAVYLAEYTQEAGLGRLVRRSLDVLAFVPSIVFGLFGAVFFCDLLGMGFSILSGGLTLGCMILPILIRSTEAGFRAVPADLRRSAAAAGMSRGSTLRYILLPAALPGIGAGLALGIGRAMGETAALLFTSGFVDRMPRSLLDSGRTLSVHVYEIAMNVPGGDANASASALVLAGLVLAVNACAAWLGGRVAGGSPA